MTLYYKYLISMTIYYKYFLTHVTHTRNMRSECYAYDQSVYLKLTRLM